MVETNPRIKLECLVEHRLLDWLLDLLQAQGVKGWTVLAAEQGRGGHGIWHGGEPTGVAEHALVVSICREEVAHRVLEALRPHLERTGMIVLKSDVEVLRAERF